MFSWNLLTAVDAVHAMTAGSLTSEALVHDCLDRISSREGVVQAWEYLDPEAQTLAAAHWLHRTLLPE